MTPHYITWSCGANCHDDMKNYDCYSNGEFCGLDNKFKDLVRGTQVLDEDLRQICLYNRTYTATPDLFWDYLE